MGELALDVAEERGRLAESTGEHHREVLAEPGVLDEQGGRVVDAVDDGVTDGCDVGTRRCVEQEPDLADHAPGLGEAGDDAATGDHRERARGQDVEGGVGVTLGDQQIAVGGRHGRVGPCESEDVGVFHARPVCRRASAPGAIQAPRKERSISAPRAGSCIIHQCPSPSSSATEAPHFSATRRAMSGPPV